MEKNDMRKLNRKEDNMRYVEAPERNLYKSRDKTLFLAGGIQNCPDWQAEMVELLADSDYIVFNPRRKDFPIHDPTAAEEQIKWEYDHLRCSDKILFWFPCESLCPIALYELGAWTVADYVPIFIGVHPDYQRRQDVEIQTRLARPGVKVVYSIADLAGQVKATL